MWFSKFVKCPIYIWSKPPSCWRITYIIYQLNFCWIGDDSTEVTATLKYNRNKDVLTADVAIPDYDVEAGIKLAVTDSDSKGKKMRGITIDVTNKNIPQLSLVGRTR